MTYQHEIGLLFPQHIFPRLYRNFGNHHNKIIILLIPSRKPSFPWVACRGQWSICEEKCYIHIYNHHDHHTIIITQSSSHNHHHTIIITQPSDNHRTIITQQPHNLHHTIITQSSQHNHHHNSIIHTMISNYSLHRCCLCHIGHIIPIRVAQWCLPWCRIPCK